MQTLNYTKDKDEIVQALVQGGHSMAVALKTVLDAKRGDDFSKQWIDIVLNPRKGKHK